MTKKIKHTGLAIAALVVIASLILVVTGTFSGHPKSSVAAEEGEADHAAAETAACGDKCAAGKEADARGETDGHAPAAKDEGSHKEADGHGAHEPQANMTPEEIEAKKCEHDIRQIDCDECRYELGVVKVQPAVTDALTKTAVVQEGELVARLQLTGEIQFDQTHLVDVLPIASGKVVVVKAQLGQAVKAGDVLAVIHSGDFGEAKAAYLETLAAADIAVKEKERQAVVSDALQKLLDSLGKMQSSPDAGRAPLGEWKSKLIGASARLQQAQSVLEREKSLVAKQVSSKAELETAEREFQTAQADYSALIEEIQLNLKLDRLKAENAARLAEAKLNAAEQRLHLFGLDDEAIQAVSHGKENGRFAQLEIRAPREGVVTARNVTEGKFVETTQCLFTVADTSNLWVWCDLYERDLGDLHEYLSRGNKPKAMVKVSAFPETVVGTVDLIGSAVDETTRTVKVRVQVKNEGGRLKPGMFASVEVELPTGRKVAIAPRQAVLSDEGMTFAFQHWKDDLWLKRDVVVGKAQNDLVEIASGLEPGSRVVCSGAFLFKSDVLREKMGAGCAD